MFDIGKRVFVVYADDEDGYRIKKRTVITFSRDELEYVVGVEKHKRDLAAKNYILEHNWDELRIVNERVVFLTYNEAHDYVYIECLKKAAIWAERAIKRKRQGI